MPTRRPGRAGSKDKLRGLEIACLGAGNMGAALLRGLARSGAVRSGRLRAADVKPACLEKLAGELHLRAFADNRAAVEGADVVILAVKPQVLDRVLPLLRGHLEPGALLVSIAAGFPTGLIESLVGGRPQVVRAMPNIAASVRMGATAIAAGAYARRADVALSRALFETCGTVTEVEESLMDAVTGLSGTGPMYVFIIIEALADAGVRMGLSRKQATELATQTVLGAAHMVQETGQHPIFLKDLVTSPGGTAINALYSMEKTGLRAVLMDAVEVATRRSRELGRPFQGAPA
jgi:pyrroline-5-carboxylate reductase